MKRKKWMITLAITLLLYFIIEIQGMNDANLNKKKVTCDKVFCKQKYFVFSKTFTV